MDIKTKLKEIDDHFKNISEEELEKNLSKAGLKHVKENKRKKKKSVNIIGKIKCKLGIHTYEMHPSDWVTCKYCNRYHPEE